MILRNFSRLAYPPLAGVHKSFGFLRSFERGQKPTGISVRIVSFRINLIFLPDYDQHSFHI